MILRTGKPLILALFVFGLAVSAYMVLHSQVAGDQLNLLARGWLLVFEGKLVPYGHPTSGGGATPGAVTSLLVGLPLFLWHDHRAATLLIWISHILAYFLLDSVVRKSLGPQERLLFAVLYWVSPWRIFYSSFLWNPNYLFLLGAVHMSTAFEQRRSPRLGQTFGHVLAVGLALQLNVGAVVLVLASALLLWRGYFRLHKLGALLGVLVVGLTLAPWVAAVAQDPALAPTGTGFIGRGLILFYPLYRGFQYWLRYPTLALSGDMTCLDFAHLLGAQASGALAIWLDPMLKALYGLTLPVSIWANYRIWKRAGRGWRRKVDPSISDRTWVEGFVRWCFLASLLAFALSPVTIMRWHAVVIFHAAVLPVVLMAGEALRGKSFRPWARGLTVYTAATLVLLVVIAAGSPPFRCGGPSCGLKSMSRPNLRGDHVMLDDLGIRRTCPVVVDDPAGWWPDVLPSGH